MQLYQSGDRGRRFLSKTLFFDTGLRVVVLRLPVVPWQISPVHLANAGSLAQSSHSLSSQRHNCQLRSPGLDAPARPEAALDLVALIMGSVTTWRKRHGNGRALLVRLELLAPHDTPQAISLSN
eukprot:3280022-Rhodomonas_salina.1